MNKIYYLAILLVLLLNIQLSVSVCVQANPTKKSTCHDRTPAYADFCCYYKVKASGVTVTSCLELTKDQKDKIKDTIDELEKTGGVDVKSLDCKSSFMQLGLFSLIFLLL
jgi:hypothetical protein